MKCKACGNDVRWNPKLNEFELICTECVDKAARAVGMDRYDLDGYWDDDVWEELGGTPFVRLRDDGVEDPNYMSSGNSRAASKVTSDNLIDKGGKRGGHATIGVK